MQGRRVTVIGSGVSGLTAAVTLQERGLQVRIVAAEPPQQTTSAVAAAVWYPYRAYPHDRVLDWSRRSFATFRALAEVPGTGVVMRDAMEIFRTETPDPWWREAVPGFRRCGSAELPDGYASGVAFPAPIAEMPVYLAYLLARFQEGGGRVETRRLQAPEELDGCDAIANCSGLGARELFGDETLTPIRGQVVRVTNPGLDRFLLDEQEAGPVSTYIVPRSRDCILGGTAEPGEWSAEPDPATARGILERCQKLEPRLIGADVLEHRVGLRPGRPTVRLEREMLPSGTPCVHNYGHGGAGMTLSWGCAEETARLIQEAI